MGTNASVTRAILLTGSAHPATRVRRAYSAGLGYPRARSRMTRRSSGDTLNLNVSVRSPEPRLFRRGDLARNGQITRGVGPRGTAGLPATHGRAGDAAAHRWYPGWGAAAVKRMGVGSRLAGSRGVRDALCARSGGTTAARGSAWDCWPPGDLVATHRVPACSRGDPSRACQRARLGLLASPRGIGRGGTDPPDRPPGQNGVICTSVTASSAMGHSCSSGW